MEIIVGQEVQAVATPGASSEAGAAEAVQTRGTNRIEIAAVKL